MEDSSSSGSDYDPNCAHSATDDLSGDSCSDDSLSDDSSDMADFIDNGDGSEEEGKRRKRTRSKYIDDGAREDNSLNGTRDAQPLAPLPGHREPHNSIGDTEREKWGTILAWTATFAVNPDVFAKAAEDRCVNPVNASERREAAAFSEIHAMYELAESVAALTGGTRVPLIITELKLAGSVALRRPTAAELTSFPDGPTCFLTGASLTSENARILTMQPSAEKLEEAGNPGGVARRVVLLTNSAASAVAGLTFLCDWTDVAAATMDEAVGHTATYKRKRKNGTLDSFQWGPGISEWIKADWVALESGTLRPARDNKDAIWARYARWRRVAEDRVRSFMCGHGKCMCPNKKGSCPVTNVGTLVLQRG